MSNIKETAIAVADNHELMRGVTIAYLKTCGHTVLFEAEDGLQLLEQLERAKTLPQVVIVEIDMPRMNRPEATERIHKRWPAIKIIGFTNSNEEPGRTAMLQACADTCILKGDDPEALHTAILTSFLTPKSA